MSTTTITNTTSKNRRHTLSLFTPDDITLDFARQINHLIDPHIIHWFISHRMRNIMHITTETMEQHQHVRTTLEQHARTNGENIKQPFIVSSSMKFKPSSLGCEFHG